jgi:hypothetical protein
LAAPRATAWSRRGRIPIQPLNNAASERLCLGLGARQSTVELGDRSPFFEEQPPVLCRPAVATGLQHCYDFSFVPSQRVDDGGRWHRGRVEQQVITVDCEFDASGARRSEECRRAHNRALQRGLAFLASGEITPSPERR